jgi:acyl carrier protein
MQTLPQTGAALGADPKRRSAEDILGWMVPRLADELGLPRVQIDPNLALMDYGLDSATAVTMCLELEEWLGRPVPPHLVWEHPSIAALASSLAEAEFLK